MLINILLLITAIIMTVSIIYSSISLGISPMPSSRKAYNTMMTLVDETGTGTIIDLGSGWGSFVIRMARRNPQRQVIGYELSLLPWLTTLIVKKLLGIQNLTLYRKNFLTENLAESSVLVCYLYPKAMNRIQEKLLLEQPNVDFLISNNFALPSWKAHKVITLNDFYKSPIYLYKINYDGKIKKQIDRKQRRNS